MEIRTEFVTMVNEQREREIRELNAQLYSKSIKRKEIKYYIMLIFVLIGMCWISTMELHAEPDYIKANGVAEQTYPATGIVTTVSESGQFVEFTDFNGNQWILWGDPEDWVCGDRIAVIMSDNGTPDSIYDDKIMSSRYCGWVY